MPSASLTTDDVADEELALDLGAHQAAVLTPAGVDTPVAAGDERIRGDRRERVGKGQCLSVSALEGEQPVGRAGIGRPGVDLGEIDRHDARDAGAEHRDPRIGTAACLVIRAEFGLGAPRRTAEEDRPPRRRRRTPSPCRRRAMATATPNSPARPASRLVEERVLIEVSVGRKAVGR